jgi:hypothetical protein
MKRAHTYHRVRQIKTSTRHGVCEASEAGVVGCVGGLSLIDLIGQGPKDTSTDVRVENSVTSQTAE